MLTPRGARPRSRSRRPRQGHQPPDPAGILIAMKPCAQIVHKILMQNTAPQAFGDRALVEVLIKPS